MPSKSKYQSNKQGGVCTNSSRHGIAVQRGLCLMCLARDTLNAKTRKRERRIRKICTTSRKHGPAVQGRSKCQLCLDKHKAYSKKYRKENVDRLKLSRRNNGLSSTRKRWRESLLARNLCMNSPKHGAPVSGKKLCQACLDRASKNQQRYYAAIKREKVVVKLPQDGKTRSQHSGSDEVRNVRRMWDGGPQRPRNETP